MVIACWCQREDTPENPLSPEDKEKLRFLYEEWAHPFFISIQEFCRIMSVRARGVVEGGGRGAEGCWGAAGRACRSARGLRWAGCCSEGAAV
jgi:hypothetical protein